MSTRTKVKDMPGNKGSKGHTSPRENECGPLDKCQSNNIGGAARSKMGQLLVGQPQGNKQSGQKQMVHSTY